MLVMSHFKLLRFSLKLVRQFNHFVFMYVCHANCQVCKLLVKQIFFTDMNESRKYYLRKGKFNCNSFLVVYLFSCKKCKKQYVGSTTGKFRLRVNNYKSHFRKFCERKAAGTLSHSPVVPQAGLFQHFCEGGHEGMSDWNFQIIDSSNNEEQLRKRESFWQYKLETFLPKGLWTYGLCQHNTYIFSS